ncbi:MAG: hypothetical protein FWG36_06900 [Oscillospiraceae bacterium]|nr:hypothetical protein [Oscillospiraceae bacterium]
MKYDFTDEQIDIAAKELMTDAPDELLKSVMYHVKKGSRPQQRRFAFGSFTAIGTVAAAVLILITIYGNDLLPDVNMNFGASSSENGTQAAPNEAPAPEAAAGGIAAMITEENAAYDSGGASWITDDNTAFFAEPSESYDLNRTDTLLPAPEISVGAQADSASAPIEYSPLELELYNWMVNYSDSLISLRIESMTDDELIAVVVYEDETIEVTVTVRGEEYVVSYAAIQD